MARIRAITQPSGGGGTELEYFSTTWYKTASGGLTVTTTKKAKALIFVCNSKIVKAEDGVDNNYVRVEDVVDSAYTLTFSDNSVTCPNGWSSQTDFAVKGYIVY